VHWTLSKNALKSQLCSALHHNNKYMHRCQARCRRMTDDTTRRATHNRAYFRSWPWSCYIWSVIARRCGSLKRMIKWTTPRVPLDSTTWSLLTLFRIDLQAIANPRSITSHPKSKNQYCYWITDRAERICKMPSPKRYIDMYMRHVSRDEAWAM
jgi:hypothetical protein